MFRYHLIVISLLIAACGASDDDLITGWGGGKAEEAASAGRAEESSLPKFICEHGNRSFNGANFRNTAITLRAKDGATAAALVSGMVGAHKLPSPNNFVDCISEDGKVAKAEDLPRFRCDHGYRWGDDHFDLREPILLNAADADTAVAVVSGLVGAGLLGAPLNYVSCAPWSEASSTTSVANKVVHKSDLPEFLCIYGYDTKSHRYVEERPIRLNAPDPETATSVLSGLIGSGQLEWDSNFIDCSTPGSVPATLLLNRLWDFYVNSDDNEYAFDFQICNSGSTVQSDKKKLSVVYTPKSGAKPIEEEIIVEEVYPGCEDVWTRPRIFVPGQYTITAVLEGNEKRVIDHEFMVEAPETLKAELEPLLPADGVEIDPFTGRVTIFGRVCNWGLAPSAATKIEVKRAYSAYASDESPIPPLQIDECWYWKALELFVEPGRHKIKLILDPEDLVAENVDAAANVVDVWVDMPDLTQPKDPPAADKADLTIKGVTQQGTDTTVTLAVTVCNDGMKAAPSTQLGIYFARPELPTCSDTPAQRLSVGIVEPGKCTSVTSQPISRVAASNGSILLFADSTCVIEEGQETNNHKPVNLAPYREAAQTQPKQSSPPASAQEQPKTSVPPQKTTTPPQQTVLSSDSDGCSLGASSHEPPAIGLILGLLALLRRRRR